MATNPPAVAAKQPINGWSRRDRPCDSCRRRKSRCIIPQDSETCIICSSRQEECTYVEVPQRRKRRRAEDENSPGEGTKPRSPDAERNIIVKPPLNDYTNLPHSLLKQTLHLQNRQHGQYLGQTSEYDTRLINLSPFNGRGEYVSTPGTLRRVSPQTHFIMKQESQTEIDDELANLDLVESIVQPHGKALVDLYFRIVHPSFPIMHKNVFLEKYARTYREFTPPMLASVYILALNWWSYSPDLVNLPKPDVHELEKLAPRFLSDVLTRPKLSTVQAGLLLLQRPDGDSWALTGQLVAVAQELGLHLDSSRWKIPEWECSLRKRLAWALYMQDKWGALIHGRPALIQRKDWCVKSVVLQDFPETAEDDSEEEGSSEIEKGRLSFINMISLTEILTDILDTFFTLRATSELANDLGSAMATTLERAKPIQLRLKDWYAKLPPCLAMGETKARKLSSSGSLHLAYFALEVTLHRAIIRFDSTTLDDTLRNITRSAAKQRFTTAVDLVNKLESTHLQSFWYFASKVNLAIIATFGSILWATSDGQEEAEFYREKLAEYRWMLRVSSKAAEFMKFTVGMLDASPVFLKENASKTATPTLAKEQQQIAENGDNLSAESQRQNEHFWQDVKMEQVMPDNQVYKVSPSLGNSTEDAHPYDQDFGNTTSLETEDLGPQWSANNINFDSRHVQDWSLDQLYSFENFPLAEDILSSRRFIQEYDESGNTFAGF